MVARLIVSLTLTPFTVMRLLFIFLFVFFDFIFRLEVLVIGSGRASGIGSDGKAAKGKLC